MTSGAILPTVGPSPPEFKRSFVPEHLRPKALGTAAQDDAARNQIVRPEQNTSKQDTAQGKSEQNAVVPEKAAVSQGSAVSLAGASAVVVQVQEGRASPEPLPPAEKAEPLNGELTDEEKAEVQRLKERDREVRAHEAAHASVGRGFTGTPHYEFVTGPDDVRYAVGGHVDIDVSEVPDDPKATIEKMEVVRAAALAPARPSGQDRAVAAAAAAKAREAQAELNKQEREELEETLRSKEPEETGAFSSPQNLSQSASDQRPVSEVSSSVSAPEKPEPISINLVI